MEDPKVFTYVEVNGRQIPFDELDDKEKERLACFLLDRFMECFGYERKEGRKEQRPPPKMANYGNRGKNG